MKLFTKEIDDKLFKQYSKGSDLKNQNVVAKIFNPYGKGRWFLLNSDPSDPDYLWAIVEMGGEIEIGSVSRRQLENIKIGGYKLPLERDLYFTPVNAAKLYRDLIIKAEDELTGESEGERRAGMDEFKEGGETESSENKEMLENQAHEIAHHSEELKKAIEKSDEIEPWVVAKVERAATDLSDVTHYLEGESKSEYKSGGVINRDLNLYVKSKAEKYAKELKPSFYKEVMAQAVVASLSDANFHKEARKLVMLLEGKEQWSDDLYQSLYYDANDDVFEFATEVSRKAEWSGDDIANAFIYAMKMTGLHSLAAQVEKAMQYAEGGEIEEYAEGGEVKWQEAERGDNALVVSENKLGLIIQAYGRKFHLRFPDGKEKTYDANELKFIKDIDDFDRGGQVKAKEYKIVPMIPYGVQGYLQQDYKNTIRFQGTEDEAIAKAKEIANSNPDFVRVEVKKESKTKTVTVGIVEGNSSKAKGGKMDEGGEIPVEERKNKTYYHVIWDDGDKINDTYFTDNKEASEKYYKLIKSGEAKVAHLDKDSFNQFGFIKSHQTISRYPKSSFADGGGTSSPNVEFMKWYVDWSKSVNKHVYVSISIPNEFSSPIKGGKDKIVILDVIEKKGDADAKKYMNEILEKADEFGVSIYLQPIPRTHNLKSQDHKKKITKDYLIKYYEKFGFKKADGGFMFREPKMAKGRMMADGGEVNPKYKSSILKMINYKIDNRIGDVMSKISYTEALNLKNKIQNDEPIDEKEVAYIKEMESYLSSKRKLHKVADISYNESFDFVDNIVKLKKDGTMAMGGKVKFKDKVAAIKKSLLKRKKVSPKVQKDYGKTYSPKEAEESAKRIVGAMTAKERLQAKLKKRKK